MNDPAEIIETLHKALSQEGESSSDFDLNNDVPRPDADLKPAAVLLPLHWHKNRLDLILTRRSEWLKNHPGQISLPGGKSEESDKSPEETALREAEEEMGLNQADVRILGRLPSHQTVTKFTMTPVVGLIEKPFSARPDPSEVAEVFRVPFAHVIDPKNYRVEGRIWQGQMRYFYTVPHGPYYIWGATARILRGLAERMQT